MAVKGPDDAERIKTRLLAHPFTHRMELVVLNVVPAPPFEPFQGERGINAWTKVAVATSQRFVDQIVAALNGPHYAMTGRVVTGDAADVVAHEVGLSDLLVVSTHGRVSLPIRQRVALADPSRGGISLGGALTISAWQLGVS